MSTATCFFAQLKLVDDAPPSPPPLPAAAVQMKEGGDVWQSVWTVSVLFSDDSARSARLQQLTSRRKQVADGIKRIEKAHGRAERALQVTPTPSASPSCTEGG